jgi:hypothetical protein
MGGRSGEMRLKTYFPVCLFLVCLSLPAQVPTAVGGIGVDLDGDGMSDLWEAWYGARALEAASDTDGDGHSNLYESRTGTDPFNPQSVFKLAPPTVNPGQRYLEITHGSSSGKQYQFSGTSDLVAWYPIGDPFQGNGGSLTNRLGFDTVLPERYFVSVTVTDPDVDMDGLTAYEESLMAYSDRARNSNGAPSTNDYARAVERKRPTGHLLCV